MAWAEKVYKVRNGKKTKQYTWRARYQRPDGTVASEPGFPTKKLAEDWGSEQERDIRARTWIDPELTRTTFGVWAKKWMDAQKVRGRTVANRWAHFDHRIFVEWEHTPLIAITWFDVEAWARALPYARETVKDCVQLMRQIMNGAVDARYLQANPLAGRRLTGLPPDPAPKKRDEDQVAPTDVVLSLARRMGPVYGLTVLTAAFAGPRVEELFGLHRDRVLLTRRQRHEDGAVFTCPIIRVHEDDGALVEYRERIEKGKSRVIRQFEPPKNDQSARDIDVPPFLAELLEKHLAGWPHPYVFTTLTGKLWWQANWRLQLRPAADGREARPNARGRGVKAEWEPIMPGLTMRDLRHTHDTWQAEDNVNPVLAHEQSGHKFPGIKGTYQHPTPEMRQYRLDVFQRRYERTMAALGWESLWS